MNWDEQLTAVCTETDGTIHPHTDHVLTGAKWMRDQLRTDEAIERVAAELAERHDETPFDQTPEFIQNIWRADARTCVSALLGDN